MTDLTAAEMKRFDRMQIALARTLSQAWKNKGQFDGDPDGKAMSAIDALTELFRERPRLAIFLHDEICAPLQHAAFTCGFSDDR